MNGIAFRLAAAGDLPAILAMLREDALGAARETGSETQYASALKSLQNQPQTTLVVGELGGEVVAFYQLTTIDGLSHCAARRGNIEDVRVAERQRGQGIGHALMEDAAARARENGCAMLQLVAHQTRHAAHRFYNSAGFTPSHVGFKRSLLNQENAQ